MRFDRRFFFVLGASLVWGLLVAAVFYRVGGTGSRVRAEAQKAVVAAAKELPAGATMDRASVKLRMLPESLFPSGGFTRVEDVLDRPSISRIHAGEPVLEADLAAKGSGMGLAPMIPPGMRAISVRVNDVVGVAGFVLPGMRVDVLVTGRPPNANDTVTRTVLQNIAVLSAGQTIQTDGKSQSMVVPVVTVLVNPQEAEALTLANNEGHIQLVLRNSTDGKTAETSGRQLRDLYGSVRPPDPEPARHSAPAAPLPVHARNPIRPQAAPVETAIVPKPEPDQMIIFRGSLKKVEVFSK